MPAIATRPAPKNLAPPARVKPSSHSMVWLCGGALAVNLLFVIGLVGLLAANGLSYFWPSAIYQFELKDGTTLLGEIYQRQPKPKEVRAKGEGETFRIQIKRGNREITGRDFEWVEESNIKNRTLPPDAVVLERVEYGNFYGKIIEVKEYDKSGGNAQTIASGSDAAWTKFNEIHPKKIAERDAVVYFEKHDLGGVNQEIERLRLAKKKVLLTSGETPEAKTKIAELDDLTNKSEAESKVLTEKLFERRKSLDQQTIVIETIDKKTREIPVHHVVRALQPNKLGFIDSVGVYFSRGWEFIAHDPRESNSEGGIFPAIFGTVLMVFLMSIAVVPLGVLAALYLREYAKQGALVRAVRIAVNNLAGVPSIVFGVFGLGFFVYLIGGAVDHLFFPEYGSTPVYKTGGILWASLTLALLTVPVVIVAAEEGLAAVPRIVREGSLALGATKFETTWRVVIPAAAPGILTGLILAIARAAGEVAPLMIVGMVKLAPALPIDGRPPFIHFEQKFMHLGFHIYDVGSQSPNVDASKPLVFATAFLLIIIVTIMNLLAISLRNHLRKKYAGAAV